MQKTITHISGKRWLDKTYGNTYHTCTLHYSDGTSDKSKVTYGYDEQYLTTAAKLSGIDDLWRWQYRKDKGITCNVADVSRKKDL